VPNRREFLTLFSAASVLSIAPARLLARVENSRFTSPVFGVHFSVPSTWHAMTAEQVLAERAMVSSSLDDDSDELPIASFTRDREPCLRMNPGFVVYGDKLEDWCRTDPIRLAIDYVDVGLPNLSEWSLDERVRADAIGSHRSASFTCSYVYELSNGFRHRLRTRTSIVLTAEHVLLFNFTDARDVDATREYRCIRDSVTISSAPFTR
jgi:hypothetical protein